MMEPPPVRMGHKGSPGSCTPFSMCIASGPFTHGGDLMYQHWHQLLKHIRAAQPDVILLVISFPVLSRQVISD